MSDPDPRIAWYTQSIRCICQGHCGSLTPLPPQDDIFDLGVALTQLGNVMEKRMAEMRTLAHLTESINTGLTLDEVLDQVYHSFRAIIPYDRIGFSLLSEDGESAVATWARSSESDLQIQKGFMAPIHGSSLWGILQSGTPRILNDLEEYLAQHPDSEPTQLIVHEGLRSSLTCPLIANDKRVGFMFFSSKQ
ncbi:TPA: GGDEF domain-containing protein, partial [Candidatus Sumerlaeota bacterium]|nr:GGDEF domain-containing protein [Candidatus Sumerlaeota bacterium]